MIFWPKKRKKKLYDEKKKHQLMCIVHVQAVMPYAYHLQKKKNLPSNELCDPDATFKITISKVVHAIQCYIIFKFRNLEIL